MSSYKLTEEQSKELVKCAKDFTYFCENYVVIKSWQGKTTQLMPFKLFPFQQDLFEHWEENQYSIGSKFRRGGFTTLAVIYGLWKCLFNIDQGVLYMAKTDRDAVDDGGRVAEIALNNLPEWMKGLSMKNDHTKKFDTGSAMRFHTPEAACGQSSSLLILDECSYFHSMALHWKSLWPVLSCGGQCIVQSNVRSDEDWFWERLIDARVGVGRFKEFKCHYTNRPEFALMDWETEMKANLGLTGWDSEYLQIPKEDKPKVAKTEIAKVKKWRSIHDAWSQSADTDSL